MGRSDVGEDQLLVFRGDGRTVYRVLRVLRPTEDDWRSNYELGAKPRNTEVISALDHMSLSMWVREGQAVAISEQFNRRLGEFVAAVELRREEGVWFAETGPEGHVAVWGRREALHRCTVEVHPF